MKRTLLAGVLCILTFAACNSREREKQLAAREEELNIKEQQLLLREKTIEFREQDLAGKELRADSMLKHASGKQSDSASKKDTIVTNPVLTGNWSVKMTCVETSCPGSAIGDVRVEQWNLSFAGNHLVAKATNRGNLVRTYSGIYNQNAIELIEHRDSTMTYDTRMVVRLRLVNDLNIEGQREIIRENDCKIVYAVTMDKLQ